MTHTPLETPAFATALNDLVALALMYPDTRSQHTYIAITPQGELRAHDLIAHAYVAQGGSLEAFTGYRDDDETQTLRNRLRLQLVWDHLYTQPALFLGLKDSERIAQNLLVYWLYGRVQHSQDKDLAWQPAMVDALKYLRRLINDKYSGFLVQTHGNHAQLRDTAVAQINEALKRLA